MDFSMYEGLKDNKTTSNFSQCSKDLDLIVYMFTLTAQKKKFSIFRIYSVNGSKFVVFCGSGHIY